MSLITEAQRKFLSRSDLQDACVYVTRGQSRMQYRLIHTAETGTPGLKSVVWKAKDDLGNDIALKIVPSEEYTGHSINDEMTEASRLSRQYFAKVLFFGDFVEDIINPSVSPYKAIASEWINNADQLCDYLLKSPITVDDFLSLAEQLFRALATLKKLHLCHDDLHTGNVLIQRGERALTGEPVLMVKIVDTGSIKRLATREKLLSRLRDEIETLRDVSPKPQLIDQLEERLQRKIPTDHFRAVECLLYVANALCANYFRSDYTERQFIDNLLTFFQKMTDSDSVRRLESPAQVISELKALRKSSATEEGQGLTEMSTPFDYISAEMIRSDKVFGELFSMECPWLEECRSLEPLYIYGPRGCGKSSVLRWLSFKAVMADSVRNNYEQLKEIGIYVSCSVELRSRFWLLDEDLITKLQEPIIRYFNLLLVEELFDTLATMLALEEAGRFNFGLSEKRSEFALWVCRRLNPTRSVFRFEGQSHFSFLKGFVRKLRWDTWSEIQNLRQESRFLDPSLAADICRELQEYFPYFKQRHFTFLIDDYSNQRIPAHLQVKLNQTIYFAKQGTPIFKVSSEYGGVDLTGIDERREVVEINIGERYTSLQDKQGAKFLSDLLNIRLGKANYVGTIEQLLGRSSYPSGNMALAIASEGKGEPFYYHGVDCIHWLCSGDVALALDVIKRIFEEGNVDRTTTSTVPAHKQHKVIQQFSHEEIRRIRHIVPDGEELFNIVCYLGYIARAFVVNKKSGRQDKAGDPLCVTHLDVRMPALQQLGVDDKRLSQRYELLTTRAILISLLTSRSRKSLSTERLQLRRILFPAFKAPLKRDTPIKIDSVDDLKSLLSNPQTFAERELRKSGIDIDQLRFASGEAMVTPREL